MRPGTISVGDRFTCKDGTVVEVVDVFHKKQTRSYTVGYNRGGYVDPEDCRPQYLQDECDDYPWEDLSWPLESNRQKVNGVYLTNGQLYLCPVGDLDDKFNEFGEVSP